MTGEKLLRNEHQNKHWEFIKASGRYGLLHQKVQHQSKPQPNQKLFIQIQNSTCYFCKLLLDLNKMH